MFPVLRGGGAVLQFLRNLKATLNVFCSVLLCYRSGSKKERHVLTREIKPKLRQSQTSALWFLELFVNKDQFVLLLFRSKPRLIRIPIRQ